MARRRARWSFWLACGLMAAALAVCVALCTRVRTGNAERLLFTVIALSTLAGWAAILLLALLLRASAAEYRHITHVLSAPEEECAGRLSLSPMAFQIPRGILIRKVTLRSGEDSRPLSLNARFARRLPPEGSFVRVKTAANLITAIEVPEENV